MSLESKQERASVKEIWEKTILRFEQRTGQTLDGASRGPDDLRRLLDAHYAAQADDKDVSTAKDVGFQIIHCIQLLGGIASQGAAMVFAPAGLCFNALSFLLEIPGKVRSFHSEIDAIFSEVGPALTQFRIYERMDESAQIDEALRQSIDQVMMSFVNLCADCINIHREGRWKGFKRNAKRILLDDSSVQSELTLFKKLTQDQLNLQATLTLEAAMETGQDVRFMRNTTLKVDTNTRAIKSDVSGLVEAELKRKVDTEREHILATIRAKLGQKDVEVAAVLEARDTMWKGSMKGSGKWLNEIDAYKHWIDRDCTADSLLIVSGEPGTGKSFLVSAIAHEIRSANVGATAERSLVGYYHFSVAERRDNDGNKKRLEQAIQSICVQLAEQDSVYARRVFSALNESGRSARSIRDASCAELWATLGVGMPAKNTTHYIILDSVDMLSPEDRERLWRAIQQGDEDRSYRVRVLLSGESEAFQGVQLLSSRMKTIEIANYNEVDIKAFIVQELKKANLFQGADKDSRRRRRMVEEQLLARSNHSYARIQQDLRQVKEIIASGGTEEELNRALHESSTDPRELVRSELKKMEATLKPREIEEIKEILVWVVAAGSFITLEEVAAALLLRFNTVSLQPLDEKITGKYSKIFTLTSTPGRRILALTDHVEDCVIAQRDRPRQSSEDPKITATITITNGDLKMVQRFFWDLNHYSFLDGFAFSQMSQQANTVQRKIQVYRVDAHLEVIKRAFDFFLDPLVDERGKVLGYYLMRNLSHHLKVLSGVTGLDELLSTDKHFIGSHVYGMFTDGEFIERNWEYFRGGSFWYCDHDCLEICWSWLDDPVAIATLGPRDKRWLADLKKDKDRNQSLLAPVMPMIARKWLRETEGDAYITYTWIEAFLALGAKSEQHNQAAVAGEIQRLDKSKLSITINENDSRLERVVKAEQWCRQSLGVTEPDYIWYVRLGDTYFVYDEQEAANKHYQKAAAILRAQTPLNKGQLRDVYKSLAESATSPETAMEYWEEASKLDEEDVDILYAMLQEYAIGKKEDEVRSIIQKALTKKGPGKVSTMMALLETAVSRRNESHMLSVFKAIFSQIFSYPELWAAFQEEMEVAIETARKAGTNHDLAIPLLLQGSAEYYLCRVSPGLPATAAGRLRECLDSIRGWDEVSSAGQEQLDFIKQSAVVRLSMLYLETAMKSDGEESAVAAGRLQQIHEDDPAAKVPKSALASLYTFKGQRDKARDLFRADMVEAFNILVDDDVQNDGDGLTTLRTLLSHTGDYENAQRAALLYLKMQFDKTILKELLAEEEPSITADLLSKYENHQPNARVLPVDRPWHDLQYVWGEVSRLATEAEYADSQRAAKYHRVEQIFTKHERAQWWGFHCTNCLQPWDNDHGLHSCKYCYNVDLCDACWGTLRSGESGQAFVCSRMHEWYELPPLTIEQYLRACREVVLMKSDDGGEEVWSVSKWLGTLCEEWGLSKADWGFE
ncbi:eukaryotic translation initiation factor 3 subunit A [Aspergillus terreus]|uniref:Eukaryotic translation initiation factor 3 subunit A n=1 Tax=Aspergillus terreus TaxID=33178 RepID=A0A5M3YWU1_ASPTE|nr:hypothetical protein ATETN484_0003076800 [Aspergillus terreus]GFF14754.1 eukaryotic translation initiation factor 3 subunit A [Aspergillus terreus]